MLADLPDQELESYSALCRSAEAQIMDRLRENVDIEREMERLCMAAAACAYYDYAMLSAGRNVSDSEVRVGEISVKSTGGEFDAASIRDHFLELAADLIHIPTGFAFRSAGENP